MTATYETFLQITPPHLESAGEELSPEWLQARGVNPGAPSVLRAITRTLIPTIESLKKQGMTCFTFLIHGVTSGVPTVSEDKNSYIHLQMLMKKKRMPKLSPEWTMTRFRKEEINTPAWYLLSLQSDLMLKMIKFHSHKKSEMDLIKSVHQSLHYFANMAQMTVS